VETDNPGFDNPLHRFQNWDGEVFMRPADHHGMYVNLSHSSLFVYTERSLEGRKSSSKFTVCWDDYYRLFAGEWLNDTIIEYYIRYIRDQSIVSPDSHLFPTFFARNLTLQGHSGVKNWTFKGQVFGSKYLLFPVNEGYQHSLIIS
jgi:Ulp1 family protease